MAFFSFLQDIFDFFKSKWEKVAPELKDAIHIGVTVVEQIKNFTDSGIADVIAAIIPAGDVPEAVLAKLREFLPKIFLEMKLAETCSNLTDPNEIVKCGIATLQQIGGDYQSAFLHDLSILLAQVAADGKLTWSDGVFLAQWYYEHYKSNK